MKPRWRWHLKLLAPPRMHPTKRTERYHEKGTRPGEYRPARNDEEGTTQGEHRAELSARRVFGAEDNALQ